MQTYSYLYNCVNNNQVRDYEQRPAFVHAFRGLDLLSTSFNNKHWTFSNFSSHKSFIFSLVSLPHLSCTICLSGLVVRTNLVSASETTPWHKAQMVVWKSAVSLVSAVDVSVL